MANLAIISCDDLGAEAPTQSQWLWDGYLAAVSITLLTSRWKSGKTTLISLLVARMGAGVQALDAHRKEGGLIVAPSCEATQWELDRQLGQKIFEKAGIATLPVKEFRSYDDAIAHVKKTMGRFVSKPCNDANADKALSYCSSGPDDMCYMLERWKKNDKLKGSFILQEFKPGSK